VTISSWILEKKAVGVMAWIHLVQERKLWRVLLNPVMKLRVQ
jgi:hypothetical protein